MEESQGLLHSPKEQAELYKVNIDLKVKSEELKKVTGYTLNFYSDPCHTFSRMTGGGGGGGQRISDFISSFLPLSYYSNRF